MKNQYITGLLFVLLSFGMQPAMAGELLIGAKTGIHSFDFDSAGSEDPTIDAVIKIGYEFMDLLIFDLAAEVEFTTSLTEGEADNEDFSNVSFGAFASFRTAGPIYFIGRVGIVDTEIDFEDTNNLDDTATALGLGIGFSTGFRWELEFTSYDYGDDIGGSSEYLSLGFSF